ncbi:endonuclease domain-containing protein [Corticibacterium sp. UT-5YL-CI-8]|nr:endonuclease domain-containing protein [Tianweitania sp. UT-5YL-CI-8]
MSLSEILLWEQLRQLRLDGLRFRRQHPIGPYVLDFYCPKARLAVEVDGAHHHVPAGLVRDRLRDSWLKRKGLHVLRIPASDILNKAQLEGVQMQIAAAAVEHIETPPPALQATSPASQGRIDGSASANPPPFTGEVARRAGGGLAIPNPRHGRLTWTPA